MFELLKCILLGIVEGITEWLPISSTGHMILVNEFLGVRDGFFTTDLFLYVIQLGAILAIVTLYFNKLNPFSPKKSVTEKKDTWQMWFKIAIATVPAGILGLLLNDFMDKFENPYTISATLIIYGIAFFIAESKKRDAKINGISELTYKTAIWIGMFQVLAIVPGTSRSGATILGAIILGMSRELAAEFSFFLSIPIMFGISGVKILTNDYAMMNSEWCLLLLGCAVAYLVSLASVKFLTGYVKKHDFKAFGLYRIVLGIFVILYFTILTR